MNKRLIEILSLFFLVVMIPLTIYLVSKHQNLFSQASVDETPSEIKITNISDNSFTLSWLTNKQVPGFVAYGETEKLGSVAADDRDPIGQTSRFTHHTTIKKINPQTTYYYKISSGKNTYDNLGKAFSVTSAPSTSDPPPLAEPAYGKVTDSSDLSVNDAIVYLTFAGGTTLSSYTRADGNWLITLNNARDSSLKTYISYKLVKGNIDILVQAGKKGTASIKADISSIRPLSTIKLKSI